MANTREQQLWKRGHVEACPRCGSTELPRPLLTSGALPREWWCPGSLGGCDASWQREEKKARGETLPMTTKRLAFLRLLAERGRAYYGEFDHRTVHAAVAAGLARSDKEGSEATGWRWFYELTDAGRAVLEREGGRHR